LDVRAGDVDSICQFISIENPDERVNVEAVSMVYTAPFAGSSEWLCRAPDELTGPITVRPMIAFRSPASADVGGARVLATQPVD
jgi:hypothetical protein